MNLLKCYIKEVHSVDDISNRFEDISGYPPNEPFLRVDLTYDCYGQTKRERLYFFKTEWERANLKGYFMG